MSQPREITGARAGVHELAVVRALTSLLEDSIARGDLRTAADLAAQIAEQVDRLRGAPRSAVAA